MAGILGDVIEGLGGAADAGGFLGDIGGVGGAIGDIGGVGGAIGDIGGLGGAIGDIGGDIGGVIGEAGGALGEAGGALGEAGGALGEAGGAIGGAFGDAAGAIGGAADGAAGAVGGVVADGEAAAAEAAEAVPQAADGLASTIRANAIQLAKFVAIEVAKGAAMSAGFLAIQKLLTAAPPSPTTSALQQIFAADQSGFNTLNTVLTDWHQFLSSEAETGPTQFGTVTVLGDSYSSFTLFASTIAKLDQFNTSTIVPALNTANTKQDVPSMQALNAALTQSANKALAIANNIVVNYQNMVQAGLNAHVADIQSAITTLASVANLS